MKPRYVLDQIPSWVGHSVKDRQTGKRVAIFFTRWRARQYRDWLNEGEEQEPEFQYDPKLEERPANWNEEVDGKWPPDELAAC